MKTTTQSIKILVKGYGKPSLEIAKEKLEEQFGKLSIDAIDGEAVMKEDGVYTEYRFWLTNPLILK